MVEADKLQATHHKQTLMLNMQWIISNSYSVKYNCGISANSTDVDKISQPRRFKTSQPPTGPLLLDTDTMYHRELCKLITVSVLINSQYPIDFRWYPVKRYIPLHTYDASMRHQCVTATPPNAKLHGPVNKKRTWSTTALDRVCHTHELS